MKIKQLIKKLSECNPDAEVIMSSDMEGNRYGGFSDIGKCFCFYDIEILLFKSEEEDREEGVKKVKPAVVLYPYM